MKADRTFTTIALSVFVGVGVYTGLYLASLTRMQISYGNPSGSLVAWYDYSWQRALFSPVENLDRFLFPQRWKYDQLKQEDTATR